jgi:dienelactone hydrolase
MGGGVALRVADDERVVGVCALAPWTTEKDWVSPVKGVKVLIAHGARDVVTTAVSSHDFARRAAEVTEVVRCELPDEGHAMLRRPAAWTRLVTGFVLDALGLPHRESWLCEAWALPTPQRLRIPR